MMPEKRTSLLRRNEVPEYLRENNIETGYRTKLSYVNCLGSLFWLHNETVNIWTHLIGFLFFLYLLLQNIYTPVSSLASDRFAIIIQLVTYQICMLTSSLFHLFSCHSQSTRSWLRSADHAGILMALFGTYVRLLANNFHCFRLWRDIHILIISLLIGCILFVNFSPNNGKFSNRTVKTPLFLLVAVYAVAPLYHWISLNNTLAYNSLDITSNILTWYVFPYILGGIGLFFYLVRVPEKVVTVGLVDIFGHSHQIWHVFILSGMVSWYYISGWVYTVRPESCHLLPP